MKLYILTVQFWNENLTCDYCVIKGVFDCKETAIEEAKKQLNAQKSLWADSYIVKLSKGKVALKSTSGISKIYTITEKTLNQA